MLIGDGQKGRDIAYAPLNLDSQTLTLRQKLPTLTIPQILLEKPLKSPTCSPAWSRRIPRGTEPPRSYEQVMDFTGTADFVYRRDSDISGSCPSPVSSSHHRSSDDLLRDPSLDIAIDFSSQTGFREHAKKKKGKAAATPVPLGGSGGGAGGGGGNEEKREAEKKDGASGDAGAGGGGKGDGDDKKDDKKDTKGKDNQDEEWETFGGTKSKKKTDVLGGLPTIPTSDFGADAFQEIKLGDDSGGKSDAKKGLASWGTKWNTGGSTLDVSAGVAKVGDGEEKGEDNPWSIDRPKPKKKGLSFGFGEEEEPASKPGDDWGFVSSKDKEKKSTLWDESQGKKDEPLSGIADSWGFGSTKKKVKEDDDWFTPGGTKKEKKGSAALLDDSVEEPMVEKKDDDMWDTWGGTKKKEPETSADNFWGSDGKKKKGSLYDDTTDTPAISATEEFGWGLSTGKKKNGLLDVKAEPEPEKNDDDFWSFSSTKRKTEKKNSIFADDDSEPPKLPETEKVADSGWNFWGLGKKKEKKPALVEDDASKEVVKDEDIWNTWGSGSKKNTAVDDLIQLDDIPTTSGGDDFFDTFGTGKADDTWNLKNDNTNGEYLLFEN